MSHVNLIRAMSIAAQRWMTQQQRAGVSMPDSGYVMVYMGQPFAWSAELPSANYFASGVVAVPVTTSGKFWQAARDRNYPDADSVWEVLS